MITRSDFLTNEVIDLAEEIKLVSPTDTPLTTLLLGRGQVVPAKDITVTWREKQLNTQRGTLKKEGAEAGTPIQSTRGSLSNLCQIIEKVTQVSGTAEALNPLGVGKTFEAEINDRLIETKRDMEWYFLNGTKTSESDDTPRQMAGISNLIFTGTAAKSYADSHVIDGTNKTFNEDMILDGLQKMWDSGSQGEYFAFVNASTKRLINGLLKNGTNVKVNINETQAQVLGITVAKIQSDFGDINLVLNRHMPVDSFLAVDLNNVQIAELRPTFYENLPKSGDYFKGHILNESTIKLLNSHSAFKIVNIGKTSE